MSEGEITPHFSSSIQDIDRIKRLPQEIWDSITQELSGDRRALKACILTCRAWRETSRRLLWRSITTPLKWHDNLISIHSLLAEHPDIAQLVSSVLLHLDFEKLLSLTPFTTLTELAVHGAVRILYLTPSALYVSGGFQMLSVTKLDLMWCEFPSLASFEQLLAFFPSVSNLNVCGGILGRPWELELPSTPVSLPRLRQLTFQAARLMPSFRRLILSAGTSLEYLAVWNVTGTTQGRSGTPELHISQNTSLEKLKIHFDIDTCKEGWGEFAAVPLAQLSASHSALLRVELHMRVCMCNRHIPCAWEDPGPLLGRQLCRIFAEHPNLTVAFRPKNMCYKGGACEAQVTLARHLARWCPSLGAHAQRLRYVHVSDSEDRDEQDLALLGG